jgi:hypothetical protein
MFHVYLQCIFWRKGGDNHHNDKKCFFSKRFCAVAWWKFDLRTVSGRHKKSSNSINFSPIQFNSVYSVHFVTCVILDNSNSGYNPHKNYKNSVNLPYKYSKISVYNPHLHSENSKYINIYNKIQNTIQHCLNININ